MSNYYKHYKTWMLKHRNLHRSRQLHQQRTQRGFYKDMPRRIKLMKKELKEWKEIKKIWCHEGWVKILRARGNNSLGRVHSGYYQRLPRKIRRWEKAYRDYKKGITTTVRVMKRRVKHVI